MAEADNHALPGAANDSWRTWLMTGSRRAPADRRRLRGAHRGLKQMLVEGMADGGDKPRGWKEFSGAMIRHAVDDAVRALPVQDKQMVKLAYFGGLSNREIAKTIGTTEATVERRLRRAIDAISDHIEHGRSLGRRAFYVLTLWLCGRWLGDAVHEAVQAAAVATAAVIIVAQPAAPPAKGHVAPPQPTPSITEVKTPRQIAPVPSVQPPNIVVLATLPPVPPIPPIPPLLPNVRPPD